MTSFDLHALIAHHNQQHPYKRTSINKTWGLAYLSHEGLETLNAIDGVVTGINKSEAYRTQVKNLDSYYQSLRELKQDTSSPGFFHRAKALCKQTTILTRTSVLQRWGREQIDWLNNADNWTRLIANNSEAKGSILKLKQFWDVQQQFVQCSNDFLLEAFDSLIEPEEHIALAETEFLKKKHGLPAFIAVSYYDFLTRLKQRLTRTKTALINTMASRLFVAGKAFSTNGDLCNDDTLAYTIQELQRIGIIKKSLHLKGHWRTLEPRHFNRFHQLIQSHGCRGVRQNLLQRPWFTKFTGTVEITKRVVDNQVCLVPTTLINLVPSKKRKPAWFFQNQHRSIKFIHEQQATIAHLNLGFSSIRPIEPDERFLRLDRYEQRINEAITNLPAQRPNFWQLWSYFGYRKLFNGWQAILIAQSHACQQERVKLLEEIAYCELPPENREERYQLWLLVRAQLSRFTEPLLQKNLVTLLNSVEKALVGTLRQEPHDFAACLMQALADKQSINADELNYLIQFIEINELSPAKNNWFESIKYNHSKALAAVLSQIKDLFAKRDINLIAPSIINSLKLVQTLGDENDQVGLQKVLKHLLFLQTKWLHQEQPVQARMRLMSIQKLIYMFGNDDIKAWFTRVDSNIVDNNWSDFLKNWQAKLKELEPDLAPVQMNPNSVNKWLSSSVPNPRPSLLDWFSNRLPIPKAKLPSPSRNASLPIALSR